MKIKKYFGFNKAFLDLDNTNCLKGILACMVLLSHLHAKVDLFQTSILGTIFSAFGYLAVSVFFFLSGYGLCEQYKSKGNKYIKSFIGTRFLPLYVQYLCGLVIYIIRDLLIHQPIQLKSLLQSFFWGETIVDMGWYFQTLFLLYLIFYFVYRFIKKNQTIYVGLISVVFCTVFMIIGVSTTWYETLLCFTLGLVFSEQKEKILSLSLKKILSFLAVLVIIFLATLLLGNKSILPDVLRVVAKMVSSLAFAVLFIAFFSYVKGRNLVTRFLGKYSFEIYLFQGLFLKFYFNIVHNDWLYMVAVTVTLIMVSVLVHPIFNKISAVLKSKNSIRISKNRA